MLVCQRVSHVSKSRDSVLGLWKATISTAVRPTSCTIPVTNCYVSMGVNLLCLLGSMKHTNLTAESSISRMGFVKALSLKKAINGSQGRANLQGISLQNRAIYAALLWVQYLHLGSWNSHGKSTIFGVFFFACMHALSAYNLHGFTWSVQPETEWIYIQVIQDPQTIVASA